jgi:peptidyl-prolyl cis-trans isomerase SurA
MMATRTSKVNALFALGVALTAYALFYAPPAFAVKKPLDGVVAVVNDDVILASELGEEVSVRLYQLGPAAARVRDLGVFTADVLAEMIDARLLIQEADKEDIFVTKEDIQPYVDDDLSRIRKSFDTDEAFAAALAKYGMAEKDLVAQLRKNVRDQLKITKLTEKILAPKVNLGEAELRAYFDNNRDELAVPTAVTLREIAVAKKPSAASAARAANALAELRRAAAAGGNFAALAKKLAEAEGGEFGASFKFKPGEALPPLARAAAGLSVGDISPVTPGPDGFWLVRLVAVEGDEREVQYVHLKVALSPADVAAARNQAEEAAAAVAGGRPFEAVAAEFSDNEETAAEGGMVGDVSMDDLRAEMPEIAAAVADLGVGEVSPVIERPEGFFVVKVEKRREGRDVTYEEVRDYIKRTLRARKLEAEQKKYLTELKAKAYIKTFE